MINSSVSDIPARLLEIGSSFEQRYQPILDFHGWRVAVLRHNPDSTPAAFHRVERHRNTNEVFILTAGHADLILCDGDARPSEIYVFPMELNVAYNIQQRVWHGEVLSPDAHIILFERSETSDATSDYAELEPAVIEAVKRRFTVKG